MSTAAARACANIALVKYWGKRDPDLNLPAAGSLSLTLAALTTSARVTFDDALDRDELVLGGAPADEPARARLSRWLDIVRDRAAERRFARVDSRNDFPTASGLASSASAFAALALAATRAAGLVLEPGELSVIARRGSGSAARSIFGGFAEMDPGTRADGADARAWVLDHATDWPLCMVIAVVGGGVAKSIGSRDAMDHCAATSPLYRGWIESVPHDLAAARRAIEGRDLAALGVVTEASALAMHAAAIASRPAVLYWQPPTLACLTAVRRLRDAGTEAYATMDAGPHVKVLAHAADADRIAAELAAVAGVSDVLVSGIGGGAELLA